MSGDVLDAVLNEHGQRDEDAPDKRLGDISARELVDAPADAVGRQPVDQPDRLPDLAALGLVVDRRFEVLQSTPDVVDADVVRADF
jgi:hypothetical protein